MKIAFDAKRITHNGTGLGNYSRYIINSLTKNYPENEYLLFSPGPGKTHLRNQIHPHPAVSFRYPENYTDRLFPGLWRSYRINNSLISNHVDLFHGLSNELPENIQHTGIPSVVTIHDLIFLKYPRYYKYIDRKIYTYKFRKACKEADRVIAVSQRTKKDIIDIFHIPDTKIEVIYQGCDPVFGIPAEESRKQKIREKYNLNSPFILYVGSIEERKNLLLLVQAIKNIGEDITVVAIGRNTLYTTRVNKYIEEYKLTDRVRILNNISFNELPVFYQLAQLFVYPSFYEGFGIPVLEALCAGVPVIAAKGSCLEEAGGEFSLYTDPHRPQELQSLIETVLHQPALAAKMVEKGKEYAKRFNHRLLSEQLLNMYKNILK